MIFGPNKRKLNREAFYVDKDQIEITNEYKHIGIDFYSQGYFEPSKRQKNHKIKESLDGHFKERSSNWSHMLGTQIPCIQGFGASYFHIWHQNLGGVTRKTLIVFKKGMKMHTMSHIKVRSTTTYHILLAKFGEFST